MYLLLFGPIITRGLDTGMCKVIYSVDESWNDQ
jgi:hypothetical protein